jgi:uncharacterized protein YjiS (DUF1127 family)
VSNRLLCKEPTLLRPAPTWMPAWPAIRAAWRRHRTRQRIAGLDGHMLRDIGVSFADAEAEANKPFWRD